MLGLVAGCSHSHIVSGLPSPAPAQRGLVGRFPHVPHASPPSCTTPLCGSFPGPLGWSELRAGRGVHDHTLSQLRVQEALSAFLLVVAVNGRRNQIRRVGSVQVPSDFTGRSGGLQVARNWLRQLRCCWYQQFQVVYSPVRHRSSPASALQDLGCLHLRLVPWASAWHTGLIWPWDWARLSSSPPLPRVSQACSWWCGQPATNQDRQIRTLTVWLCPSVLTHLAPATTGAAILYTGFQRAGCV